MLSLYKFLPHTEDKVLALMKISSLTGYSEMCQLLLKYTLSFVDVQNQCTTQTQPHMILWRDSHASLDRHVSL